MQALESPAETARAAELSSRVAAKRATLVRPGGNFSAALLEYTDTACQAVQAGLDPHTHSFSPSWDYTQSVFFTTTILTTIG